MANIYSGSYANTGNQHRRNGRNSRKKYDAYYGWNDTVSDAVDWSECGSDPIEQEKVWNTDGQYSIMDVTSAGPVNKHCLPIIVYDLETIHTRQCQHGCRSFHYNFQDEDWASVMAQTEIIQFGAREYGTANFFTIDCGASVNMSDVRCQNAVDFARKHGHIDIIQRSTYDFRTAWVEQINPWMQEIATRGGQNAVIMVAHNGELFDHLIMVKEVLIHNMTLSMDLYFADSVYTLANQGRSRGIQKEMRYPLSTTFRKCGGDPQLLHAHTALDDVCMLEYMLANFQNTDVRWADFNLTDAVVEDAIPWLEWIGRTNVLSICNGEILWRIFRAMSLDLQLPIQIPLDL